MAARRFLLLGLAVAAITAATVATSLRLPGGLALHLALFVGAGLVWLAVLAGTGRIAPRPGDLRVLVGIAVLMRVPAWLAPPVHSDDVYRYAWDGRVSRAGINPYRYAPADPALAALRDDPRGTNDAIYQRINNRDLPTIYPPAAQLVFLVAALVPLPPLVALKALLAIADLGVLALLIALLRRGDARWAAAWGWSPLVAIEVGQNAHLEPLALVGLVAALRFVRLDRPERAGIALFGPLDRPVRAGIALFARLDRPARRGHRARARRRGQAVRRGCRGRSWRAWAAALATLAIVALPFMGAGGAVTGSTGEFARRWRGNDGAFAVVQAITDRIVCPVLGAPRVDREGPPCDTPLDLGQLGQLGRPGWLGRHAWLATVISGRPRSAIYPDELSGFAARAIVGLLMVLACAWAVARRLDLLASAELILGAMVLLMPAPKPWYATWLLPLAACSRRPAWLVLAALAPLAYVPLGGWLSGGPWRDPVWTRLLEHGLCWTFLAVPVLMRRFPSHAAPK